MLWTTIPAMLIALVGFAVLGLGQGEAISNTAELEAIAGGISGAFTLSPVLLLPPG